MRCWSIYAFYAITALFSAHQLEGKLALEHSPKSSEMLSNAIYSSKNNEITEMEQLNGEKEAKAEEVVANEIEIEAETGTSVFLRGKHEVEIVNLNDAEQVNNKKLLEYQNEENQAQNDVGKEINKQNSEKVPMQKAEEQLIRKKNENGNENANANGSGNRNRKFTNKTTTTKSPVATIAPSLKSQRPSSFINPFGQLSAFLGGDQLHQLHDYNFLFNAERHTIFQLHTTASPITAMSSGRVLNAVVGNSLSAAFGVNPTTVTGAPPSKVEEVQLYNAASLRQSHFNPFNPTRILIHGWFGGSHAGVYNNLVPEYLKLANGSYNILTVDWGRGAIADYITASYRVKPVGKVVAKFIDFLHRESGMRYEDLHVIGFSMGAHIAGIAGKHVQTGRLPIIYALDPALPLFRYENIDERIALTDADYVEVIHTSVGSYGYDRPLGHVDFYVNYGSGQPGCFFNECSHFRAFQLLAESLHSPEAFRGQGCDVKLWLDLTKNRRCLMGTGRNLTMGGDPTDVLATRRRGGGVYYFATNASPPFAKS